MEREKLTWTAEKEALEAEKGALRVEKETLRLQKEALEAQLAERKSTLSLLGGLLFNVLQMLVTISAR